MQLKIKRLCKKLKIKITKKVGKRRVYKSLTTLKKQIKMKLKKRNIKSVKSVKNIKRKSSFGIETIVLSLITLTGLFVGYKVYKLNQTFKKIKMVFPKINKKEALIISGYMNYPEKDKENYWKDIKEKGFDQIDKIREYNDIKKDKLKEKLVNLIEKMKSDSKEVSKIIKN